MGKKYVNCIRKWFLNQLAFILRNLRERVRELEAKHADLKRGLNFVKEDCLKLKKKGVILSQKNRPAEFKRGDCPSGHVCER